jgi:AAA+ ATPase superfamily predicted ATPase
VYPVTEKNPAKSKKGIYKVSDNFIKFWFNYVYPNRSQVEMGSYAGVLKSIHKTFPAQEALTYERACCEHLLSAGILEFAPDRAGRWWDNHNEIDIVGINDTDSNAVFAGVKWTKKPADVNLNPLITANKAEWLKSIVDKKNSGIIIMCIKN